VLHAVGSGFNAGPVDAEIVAASNDPEQLRPLFEKVDVVINVSGPFMQIGWPIVATALEMNCLYLDTTGEPPKDDVDVQRSVIVCYGQGRQVTTQYVMNLSARYSWTGEICAEGAQRLLNGQLKTAGIQSVAKAFGHRELITTFHELGYCSALPEPGTF